MFNVAGKEFVFLVLIALVVLGPEKLPDLFRRLGRAYSEFRRMSEGFQDEFRRAIDEPASELRETRDLIRESVDLSSQSSSETSVQESAHRDAPNGDDTPGDDTPGDDVGGSTETNNSATSDGDAPGDDRDPDAVSDVERGAPDSASVNGTISSNGDGAGDHESKGSDGTTGTDSGDVAAENAGESPR